MALAAGAASYIRNVGRSLMYSTVDVLKDNTPFLNSLFKESKETVSSLYSSIKDFTSGKGTDVKSMGKDVISSAWKNLTDDLKTGNWYNKERDSVMNNEMMKMMGFDMEDMDFSFDDDSLNFGSDTDDISDGEELIVKQNAKNTAATIMAVDKVGAKVASSVNRGTAESANYIVSSSRSMNKAMMQLNSKGFATITEAIATLNKNTIGMNEAIAKPLTTFMQNGTLFFTRTTESLNKMTNLLEELLKRTPNMAASNKSSSNRRPTSIADIISGDGFSVSAYKELVTGNVKDMTSMISSLFGMMGGGGKGAAGLAKGWSPLRLLTTGLMKAIIPVGFTTALKSFDIALKDFIPSLIAKEMSKSGKGGFLSNILRSIFLPKNELVRRVSAKDYNQGPIPFDGQTKKAITDVIPTYLANILAAINGTPVTKYDYSKGSFTKVSDIEKIASERERSYANKGGGKLREEALSRTKGNSKLTNELENFFLEAFLSGENIADINKTGFKNTKLGKTLSPGALKILRQLVRTGKYNAVPGQMMLSRAEMTKYMRELSASGLSIDTAMVDNSSILHNSKVPGAVDKFGYSSLDYLRGIYYNTMGGGGSSGGGSRVSNATGRKFDLPFTASSKSSKAKGSKGGTINNIGNSDDDEAYNAKIDQEIIPLIIQVGKLKAKGQSDSKGDEIARLEEKIDKLDAKYKGTNKDARLAVIQATTRASTWIGDKIGSDKTSNMIKDFFKKKVPEPVLNLLNRPIDAVSRLLDNLTNSMTTFLWGDGTKDGIFTQIKKKISGFIDNNETLSKFMDSIFGEKDENGKRTGLWNETKSTLKEYWSFIKSGFGAKPSTPDQAARGRRVTKTGLVAVSEGEMIIPSDMNPFYRGGYSRSQQSKAERNAVRRFYGSFANGTPGTGTTAPTSDTEEKAGIKAGIKNEINKVLNFFGGGIDPKKKEQFKNFMKDTGFNEVKKARGGIGAGALVGTGVLGMLGSPILGLLLGSTVGFVAKSEKAQKFLFGDFDDKGNRTGGFFGAKTSNFLEKVAPDMMRGGTIGMLGGAALIGGPLGMIGGLVAGTAIGFAKKSGKAQEFLFGKFDEEGNLIQKGLFDKTKFNKTLPKVLVGAGLGALVGPAGGLFTNMILGAGAGLIASTSKVHDFLFGKKGENGRKKDGLMYRIRDRLFGGIEDLFMNTKNWFKVAIERWGKKLVDKAGNIKSWVSKRIARSQALNRVQQTLLRKFGNGGLTALKGLGIGLGAGIFGLPALAPFLPYALKGGAAIALPRILANRRMRKNARRGYNIYDKKLGRNMTAEERMAYRDKHKVRTYDSIGRWDKFDERIAGLKAGELEEFSKQLSLADDNGRGMKRIKNEAVTKFYNIADGSIRSDDMSRIAKLIEKGDVKAAIDIANELGLDKNYIDTIRESAFSVKDAKSKGEDIKRQLAEQYGFKGGLSDITKAQDLIKNELDAKSAEEKTEEHTSDINDKLSEIIDKGIKIRKDSKEAVLDNLDNTKEETQKDSEEEILDNLDNPNFFKDKRGRYHDKKTGRFMSQEQVDIARGYRYINQNDGSQLKQIWNKSKNKWELDLRDQETKEEHKQGEELEDQQLKTNSILEKMSSGFTNLKDKFFGTKEGEEKEESFFDTLKGIGKALLTGTGIFLGLKLLPNFLDWFQNGGFETIKNLFSGIGTVLGKIFDFVVEGVDTLTGLFNWQTKDAEDVPKKPYHGSDLLINNSTATKENGFTGTRTNTGTDDKTYADTGNLLDSLDNKFTEKDETMQKAITYEEGTHLTKPSSIKTIGYLSAAGIGVVGGAKIVKSMVKETVKGLAKNGVQGLAKFGSVWEKACAGTARKLKILGFAVGAVMLATDIIATVIDWCNQKEENFPDSSFYSSYYMPKEIRDALSGYRESTNLFGGSSECRFASNDDFCTFIDWGMQNYDLDIIGWCKAQADHIQVGNTTLDKSGLLSEEAIEEGRELRIYEEVFKTTWYDKETEKQYGLFDGEWMHLGMLPISNYGLAGYIINPDTNELNFCIFENKSSIQYALDVAGFLDIAGHDKTKRYITAMLEVNVMKEFIDYYTTYANFQQDIDNYIATIGILKTNVVKALINRYKNAEQKITNNSPDITMESWTADADLFTAKEWMHSQDITNAKDLLAKSNRSQSGYTASERKKRLEEDLQTYGNSNTNLIVKDGVVVHREGDLDPSNWIDIYDPKLGKVHTDEEGYLRNDHSKLVVKDGQIIQSDTVDIETANLNGGTIIDEASGIMMDTEGKLVLSDGNLAFTKKMPYKSYSRAYFDKNTNTVKGVSMLMNQDGTRYSGGRSGLKGKGSGFVSQLDPRYASKSYGGTTVGQAGCAPAVASMVSSLYGKNLSMDQAVRLGDRFTNLSGTDTEYFRSVLGSEGINANYTSPQGIINSLANNKPVILLGQDGTNTSKASSPFGPLSHYVLATGVDKAGNIIVNDPELSNPRRYSPNILKSTLAGMTTGLSGGSSGVVTINGKTYVNGKLVSGDMTNEAGKKAKQKAAILKQNGQNTDYRGKTYVNGKEVSNTYISNHSDTNNNTNLDYSFEDTTTDGTDILSKIMSIFSAGIGSIFSGTNPLEEIAKVLSGDGNTSSEMSKSTATAASYIPPQSSDVSNKMNQLVQTAASLVKKERYSQDWREQVINGTRYSDCSSFARRMYKNTFGVDIGGFTDPQWKNAKSGKNGLTIIDANKGNRPDKSKLRAGDLIYWWGPTSKNEDQVAHVEIYDGNGKIIGQDAGKSDESVHNPGPLVKDYDSFRKYSTGDRYLGAVRYTGSGSGSGLVSNAYNNLISKAKSVGRGSGISKTNNIILAGRGTSDGMLEQLVAAILELLTKIADMDSKDVAALANIKANTDHLATISEFLGKYKEFKKAEAKAKSNDSINRVDDRFKSIVEQAAAIAKG